MAPSPPVSVFLGGETHRGAVGAAARPGGIEGGWEWRPGEGDGHGGLGHAEVGSPASPWLLGARVCAPSPWGTAPGWVSRISYITS